MKSIIKAITLYQPWATLLACKAKIYETRSWYTNYRGLIAIHAGKKNDFWYGGCDEEYLNAVYNALKPMFYPNVMCSQQDLRDAAIYGALIATAELVGCYKINSQRGASWIEKNGEMYVPIEDEYIFGDWTPGRFAWGFTKMTMLPAPIPAKGKQGLWDLDYGVLN